MNRDSKETQATPDMTNPLTSTPRFNWPIFCCVLLSPPLLTIFAVRFLSKSSDASLYVVLIGGGIAGIISGVMLGQRGGKTRAARIVGSILLALVMIVVCISMSCFGCLVGGYHLNIH